MGSATAPLQGIRILDLSRVLAGPYCTMLLADLGADVIKVERPEGDETRGWGPPYQGGEASYYLSLNRGKRSVTLDLRSDADRELLLELSEGADAVVENFRRGGAESLGVGFEELCRRRADLVYCSISGFGSGRQPSDRPGYDFLAQAESGLMAVTGGEEPFKVGVPIVDVVTGLHLTIALIAALRERDRSGEAQRIEVSLLDSATSALVNAAANALATAEEPRRWGNAHPNIVPYQAFAAADGWIVVAVGNDKTFQALCRVLDLESLAAEERFATNAARVTNREELVPLLAERFGADSAAAWVERLAQAGVPAGEIRGIHEALAAAERAGESLTFSLPHPRVGELEMVKPPFSFNGERPTATLPPPLLGQHNEEVRRDGWGERS